MPNIDSETLQILITLASEAICDRQERFLRTEARLRRQVAANEKALLECERMRKALNRAMDVGRIHVLGD